MSEHKKIWYLSKIQLLSAMSSEDMALMDKISHMESTAKYQPVYLPGDPATSIYMLKKGRVRISSLSEEGKQVIHSILGPGNIFGELSLVDDAGEHESMAEALEETLLCIVHKNDFEAFLESHPQLNLKVTKLMGMRLRQVTSRVQDLVFKTAEQRIESVLKYLSREHGEPSPDGTLINLPLTHQDLGELTNLARPTVTDLLKHLQAQGKIRMQKRKIIWLNPATSLVT